MTSVSRDVQVRQNQVLTKFDYGYRAPVVKPATVKNPKIRLFKSVKRHSIAATYLEVLCLDGEIKATYTYAECCCGEKYVIKQEGPLTSDRFGWSAKDEIEDAKEHFKIKKFYYEVVANKYQPERNKLVEIR